MQKTNSNTIYICSRLPWCMLWWQQSYIICAFVVSKIFLALALTLILMQVQRQSLGCQTVYSFWRDAIIPLSYSYSTCSGCRNPRRLSQCHLCNCTGLCMCGTYYASSYLSIILLLVWHNDFTVEKIIPVCIHLFGFILVQLFCIQCIQVSSYILLNFY